jgi:hypothetical protein
MVFLSLPAKNISTHPAVAAEVSELLLKEKRQIEKITIYYLYYKNIRSNELKSLVKAFDLNLKKIDQIFPDRKDTNIWPMLEENRRLMQEVLDMPFSKDNAWLLVDISVYMSEIFNTFELKPNKNRLENDNIYLLLQVIKYYTAIASGIASDNIVDNMQISIKDMDESLGQYDASKQEIKTSILDDWLKIKQCYTGSSIQCSSTYIYHKANSMIELLNMVSPDEVAHKLVGGLNVP